MDATVLLTSSTVAHSRRDDHFTIQLDTNSTFSPSQLTSCLKLKHTSPSYQPATCLCITTYLHVFLAPPRARPAVIVMAAVVVVVVVVAVRVRLHSALSPELSSRGLSISVFFVVTSDCAPSDILLAPPGGRRTLSTNVHAQLHAHITCTSSHSLVCHHLTAVGTRCRQLFGRLFINRRRYRLAFNTHTIDTIADHVSFSCAIKHFPLAAW